MICTLRAACNELFCAQLTLIPLIFIVPNNVCITLLHKNVITTCAFAQNFSHTLNVHAFAPFSQIVGQAVIPLKLQQHSGVVGSTAAKFHILVSLTILLASNPTEASDVELLFQVTILATRWQAKATAGRQLPRACTRGGGPP